MLFQIMVTTNKSTQGSSSPRKAKEHLSDGCRQRFPTSEPHPSNPEVLSPFPGWKGGVVLCTLAAVAVCIVNIVSTVWAVATHHANGGFTSLYTGSCATTAKMSFWIHLVINILSTTLLSASNYTMQVISSPTRQEVDSAHRRSKWLDIGIPSFRNLLWIKKIRVFLWAILAVSSIPLHLLYNSAIFQSLSANDYDYIVVQPNFLGPIPAADRYTGRDSTQVEALHEAAINGTLAKYDPKACMTAYASNYVSKVRSVLLVTENPSSYFGNGGVLWVRTWDPHYQIPYSWICGDFNPNPYVSSAPSAPCTLQTALNNADTWGYGSNLYAYCLVEVVPEQCSIEFSLVIMLIVIAANTTKVVVMVIVFLKFRAPTLVTLGYAVASFLNDPDPTTAGMCMSTKKDVFKAGQDLSTYPAKPWFPKRHFWFNAVSIKRWLTCNILCLSAIGISIWYLLEGFWQLDIKSLPILYSLGFGTVNSLSVITSINTGGLISTALFANIPQAILSFLYVLYNGLFSCYLGAHEWSDFAYHRKPLRVTDPKGEQLSTRYLQLPYQYALPLMALSGTLHWLMSQSLFLAFVTVRDADGNIDSNTSLSKVGYSCIAIFCSIIIAGFALLVAFLIGFCRYPAGMPLVGNCSAVISAACHAVPQDTNASLKPLKWGAVDGGTGVGHCCFSSLEVREPVEGRLYAGLNLTEG
ncbi:hypothetical protein B0J14DRAFT_687753 [Halenospora varia]|nr:hypothetical protein B0J14DRAFT_687753 [Halenospora varia]